MKFDLVMWTLNSEKWLIPVLDRINEVVPEKYVNRKIVVDGGSSDATCGMADFCGWEVVETKLKSIGRQANVALEMVETPFFCSFEHDVLISDDWFERMCLAFKNDSVVVSQGIRFSVNPILKIFEVENYLRSGILYSSIDNNMFDTDFIRDIGGFDNNILYSVDTELKYRVLSNGGDWFIDGSCVSVHLKEDFRASARHFQRHKLVDRYRDKDMFFDCLKKLGLSLPLGFYMGVKYRNPLCVLGYLYWRLVKMETACKVRVLDGFKG